MFTTAWSVLCTAPVSVEVTLFYAVLWFGYVSALLSFAPIYCRKEVAP